MADKKFILTQEEYDALDREYLNLLNVERPALIEKLQLARSQGDLSENADYDAAKERQSQIEGRIAEIEHIFNNMSIVDGSKKDTGKAGIGYLVTYKETKTGEEVTIKIVGNVGADPMAIPPAVSNESPIGKAIIGLSVGKKVTIPVDEPYEVEILHIEKAK